MFAVFFALIGSTLTMALYQARDPACVPNPRALGGDDGFWALLGQVFLQVLASYCAAYAVLNNREVQESIGIFWFWFSLATSLTTSIAAVIVYGWRWQASTVLSAASGFVQLIPAAQLAWGLGTDEVKTKMQRRRTLKTEEAHTD